MADLSAAVGDALAAAARRLRAVSGTSRLDAEVLLAHVLERDRSWLLAHPDAPIDQAATAAFDSLVERRATGEPVAYLRGFKEWRSLRMRTDPRALIPRPETELLADAALAEVSERLARDGAPIVAWDVGTGTGAVSLALALRFRSALALGRLRLIASDVSADALELAAENLAAHEVAGLVDLASTDLLESAGSARPRPDVAVTNLPYVPTAEVRAARGSPAHEPPLALDGGPDGLDVIRRLVVDLRARTASAATVLLEIGAGQADAVAAMAPADASVRVERDLGGIERVVRIDMPSSAT